MHKSIVNVIGNTPMIRLFGLEESFESKCRIYAKLEYLNPFGSIKDRVALKMISDVIKMKDISSESRILEASSGNLGIALSGIGKLFGFSCTIIMPENTHERRVRLIREYGAEVFLTDSSKGMLGSIEKAIELKNCDEKFIYLDQFKNPASIKAHFLTTADEIYHQLSGEIGAIVCGVGSGGTAMGLAEYYKNKETEIIGVLPDRSSHSIHGIGAGFIPDIFDKEMLMMLIYISDNEAIEAKNLLLKTDGLLIGYSSGAVVSACKKLVSNGKFEKSNIVLIFADSGERYI